MKYTSVLVDIDRGGVKDRVAQLDEEGRHAISTVTLTELRLGVNERYERGTEAHEEAIEAPGRLCVRVELVAVSRPIAVAAADIIADLQATGERLDDLHDVYIAATARVEQLPVCTANVSHFERIDNVTVIDWTTY